MQPTTETINASGAPVAAASQSESPKWATQTPDEITYDLCMSGEHGIAESVVVTRDEYIKLKAVLAKMRGFEVPDDEGEIALMKTAEPTKAAAVAAGPISGRLVGSMFDRIITDLEGHRDFVATYHGRAKWDASDWSEFQADLALLHEIIEDWTQDGHTEEYPNETKLIGTIRAYLE